ENGGRAHRTTRWNSKTVAGAVERAEKPDWCRPVRRAPRVRILCAGQRVAALASGLLAVIELRKKLVGRTGSVGTQFDSPDAGGVGPKKRSTEPSAFFCSPGVCDERPTHRELRMNA